MCARIRELGVPESNILLLHDPLSFGPVLAFSSAEVPEIRKQYWAGLVGDMVDASELTVPYSVVLNNVDRLHSSKEIRIWVGGSLDEQLFLVWLVALLRFFDVDPSKLRHVDVTRDPVSGDSVSTFSTMSFEALSRVSRDSRRIDSGELSALAAAWIAFTSEDPNKILEFGRSFHSAMPLVRDRISMLRYRYPSIDSGLNDLDYFLLSLCRTEGTRDWEVVREYILQRSNDPAFCGDLILRARLLRMSDACLRHPLLRLSGDPRRLDSMSFALTEFGQMVLQRKANAVQINGIDEWIGGVHLQSPEGRTYYLDESQAVFVAGS